jgi:hypothetical protein
MRGLALVFALGCFSSVVGAGVARAEPRNGETVRVSLAGRSQKAVGLRWTDGGGWLFEVAPERTHAELIDMTPGTPARTLSVPIVGGVLKLDGVRFAGGHVYRAQLSGGARPAAQVMLLYLHADPAVAKLPAKKGTERVRFDGDEAAAPEADDGVGISRVEKGSL